MSLKSDNVEKIVMWMDALSWHVRQGPGIQDSNCDFTLLFRLINCNT